MKASGITIFTTTKGDQANVLRLEEYLHQSGFSGEFLVICANKPPGLTEQFQRENTKVINMPGISISEAFYYAGREAKNDLIQFVGDDDFPVINNLERTEKKLTSEGMTNKMICVAGKSCWVNYNLFKGPNAKTEIGRFIKMILLHKLGMRIDKSKGDIVSKIIKLHDNYQVFQFGLFTKKSWQSVFNKEFGEIKDIHMQEIASSFVTAAAIEIIETSKYMYLRGTGHARPNTILSEAQKRNRFNYQECERELRQYVNKLSNDKQITEQVISACLSYRLLSSTQLKRYEENNDNDKNKINIYERVKDLATDEGLLDSISTILSMYMLNSTNSITSK